LLLSGRKIEPYEAAIARHHHGLAVRGEAVARGEIVVVAAFLPVMVDRPGDPAVLPGREVAQAQAGFAAIAPRGIGEQRTIGREHRMHAARHHRLDRAGGQIAARDRPGGRVFSVQVWPSLVAYHTALPSGDGRRPWR
jgi:hypothetical protein